MMTHDPANDRVEELLIRWDELRGQGHALPAEELCADSPELAPELRRRIAAVLRLDPVLDLDAARLSTTPESVHPTHAADRHVIPGLLSAVAVYRPQHHHARGGLGEVLAAHQEELDRTVALKRIRPEKLHEEARRRFVREAAITAQLQHPATSRSTASGKTIMGRFTRCR